MTKQIGELGETAKGRLRRRHRFGTMLSIFAILLVALTWLSYRNDWIKPIDPELFTSFQPGTYPVKTFVDGDTLIISMNGVDETVRFIGVDTPETHKPDTPVQCYGPDAAAYTKQRIGTSKIRLVSDRLTTDRDRYNRLLRYVVLEDGVDLNLELIQKGYAFAYAFPTARNESYNAAMQQAKESKSGLWGACRPFQDTSTGQWHTPSATN